jgi:hypothetical protein
MRFQAGKLILFKGLISLSLGRERGLLSCLETFLSKLRPEINPFAPKLTIAG